jgi:hypothetical protein
VTRPLRTQAELDDVLRSGPGVVPVLRGGPFVVRGDNVVVDAAGDSEAVLHGATATVYDHARVVAVGARVTLYDRASAALWGGDVDAWDDARVRICHGRAAVTDRASVVVARRRELGSAPIVIAAGQALVAAYAPAWIRLHQRAGLVCAPAGSVVELGTNARLGQVGRGCIVMGMDETGPLEEELTTLAAVRVMLTP